MSADLLLQLQLARNGLQGHGRVIYCWWAAAAFALLTYHLFDGFHLLGSGENRGRQYTSDTHPKPNPMQYQHQPGTMNLKLLPSLVYLCSQAPSHVQDDTIVYGILCYTTPLLYIYIYMYIYIYIYIYYYYYYYYYVIRYHILHYIMPS